MLLLFTNFVASPTFVLRDRQAMLTSTLLDTMRPMRNEPSTRARRVRPITPQFVGVCQAARVVRFPWEPPCTITVFYVRKSPVFGRQPKGGGLTSSARHTGAARALTWRTSSSALRFIFVLRHLPPPPPPPVDGDMRALGRKARKSADRSSSSYTHALFGCRYLAHCSP